MQTAPLCLRMNDQDPKNLKVDMQADGRAVVRFEKVGAWQVVCRAAKAWVCGVRAEGTPHPQPPHPHPPQQHHDLVPTLPPLPQAPTVAHTPRGVT